MDGFQKYVCVFCLVCMSLGTPGSYAASNNKQGVSQIEEEPKVVIEEQKEEPVVNKTNSTSESESPVSSEKEGGSNKVLLYSGIGAVVLIGAGVAMAAGGGGSDGGSGSLDHSKTIAVYSTNSSWTNSGISLTAGQSLIINATGCVKNGPGNTCLGPDGKGYVDSSFSLPAPGKNVLSLVGKVGSTIFGVGRSYAGVAPGSGTLSFIYNDSLGGFGNNSGMFQVVIQY